jgi:hypothetical protein
MRRFRMPELRSRAGSDNGLDACQLLAFLKSVNDKGTPTIGWRVFLDSVGGDLNAGLALGRILRKGGFNTLVGGRYQEVAPGSLNQRTVLPDSGCFSACAYAFMGGPDRRVAKDGALGVHQFYSRSGQIDEGLSQTIVTLIGLYLDEMGISRHLLDAASVIPGGRMRTLTIDEARRLGVDNSEPLLASWELRTTADGRLYVCVPQVISARKSVSVCLGREAGHWVADITFVNHETIRSNDEVLSTLNDALTSQDGLEFHKPDDLSNPSTRLSPIALWQRIGNATYQTKAAVPDGVIQLLRSEPQFVLATNIAHAWEDVDVQLLGLTLGTDGLPPLLKAIERQVE